MATIDKIDQLIIYHIISSKKGITTYSLAKKIFKDGDKADDYSKKVRDNKIRTRLKKLSECYGLVSIEEKNSKKNYYLFADKCFITDLKINNLKINCKMMFLNINSEWCAFTFSRKKLS